jgi:release factor glutamine methyltransferase
MRSGLPALEVRLLLMHVTGLSRPQLITQDRALLPVEQQERFAALLARRVAGEPLAYLVGTREFYGRPFAVTPAVLIPRPETEHLVEWSLEVLRAVPAPTVLDLGTGTGIVAVTLALECPRAAVWAVDVSANALDVARRNAVALHAPRVNFVQSDWYAALEPSLRCDLVVSNPPYIAAGDAHLRQGDLRFEPADALTDHGSGLSDLAAIVAGAPAHLAPGGWLLMEHGYDQGAAVRDLLAAVGFTDVATRQDLAGHDRCTGGRLRPAPGNSDKMASTYSR